MTIGFLKLFPSVSLCWPALYCLFMSIKGFFCGGNVILKFICAAICMATS